MSAYNRWLQEYCAYEPRRLIGIGQTAVASVESAIEDVKAIKEMGFKGVYMPSLPWTDFDYSDPRFDPLWEVLSDLELPMCFHTFGTRRRPGDNSPSMMNPRGGSPLNGWHTVIRDNQDVIGMFIFNHIFERFPKLKLVCVEADAGWAPHFIYRMDHMYLRHRFHQKAADLQKLPGEYFRENVWLTFQDDLVAFKTVDLMNPRRLMWANDFPHADSTWPWSHSLLIGQTEGLSEENMHLILHQNVKDLFQLDIE